MQSPSSSPAPGRPYRSHLRPACIPCRRRKSRCKIEAHAPSCLMCSVHGTQCIFPQKPTRDRRSTTAALRTGIVGQQDQHVPVTSPTDVDGTVATASWPAPVHGGEAGTGTHPAPPPRPPAGPTPLSVDDEDQENPHIVGPANTNDSQVLADYLSIVGSGGGSGMRMMVVQPVLATSRSAKPVLFAAVKKRPVGVEAPSTYARDKLHIIEQLLAPDAEDAVELYEPELLFALLSSQPNLPRHSRVFSARGLTRKPLLVFSTRSTPACLYSITSPSRSSTDTPRTRSRPRCSPVCMRTT